MVIYMKILFQGDSVTDAGRNRGVEIPNFDLGSGYVNLVCSRLTCDNPKIEIYNRGVSGDRIADAYSRWLEDTLNMEFDVFSALFGINDTGFGLRMNRGSSLERFEFIYDRMLFEVREKAPDCKMILAAPFIFKLRHEESGCDIYNNWDAWYSEIRGRGEIVKKLAEKYNARFLPLLDIFENARREIAPAEHWSRDCIHPTPAGHELIARSWINAMGDVLNAE